MRNKPKTATTQCIPRLRNSSSSSSCTTKIQRFTPVSLLERFREAVFRLIMLSALSKANNNNNHPTSSSHLKSCSTPSPPSSYNYCYYYYNPADAHYSEAVKDCIEFIKKNASSLEENCECVNGGDSSSSSSSSSSSMDVAAELVLPVPVM